SAQVVTLGTIEVPQTCDWCATLSGRLPLSKSNSLNPLHQEVHALSRARGSREFVTSYDRRSPPRPCGPPGGAVDELAPIVFPERQPARPARFEKAPIFDGQHAGVPGALAALRDGPLRRLAEAAGGQDTTVAVRAGSAGVTSTGRETARRREVERLTDDMKACGLLPSPPDRGPPP